jgi:hypothetical protein
MDLSQLNGELRDRRSELDDAQEAFEAAQAALLRAQRAYWQARATHQRAVPKDEKAPAAPAELARRLKELRAEILADHSRIYEAMSALDTPDVVVHRGLKKVAQFVEALHPAVRLALDLECPDRDRAHPSTYSNNGPSWTGAPRSAISGLEQAQILPSGDVLPTLWNKKNLRGGSKPEARDEFLRRLSEAFRSCYLPDAKRTREGTSEYRDALVEFLRAAADDGRPRPKPECPKTWSGFSRILPESLHYPPVSDWSWVVDAATEFRSRYGARERRRSEIRDKTQAYREQLMRSIRETAERRRAPSPEWGTLFGEVLPPELREPPFAPKPARGRA